MNHKETVALYELKYLVANNYSPRTQESYLRSINLFLDFVKEKPITRHILIAYKDHIASLDISIQTKNIRIIPVRSFLKFLNQRDEKNYIDYKEIFTIFSDRNGDRNHINIPKGIEIVKFLSALKNIDEKYYVFAQIAVNTGMRIAEILSLKKGDVQTNFKVVGKGAKQRPIMCSEGVVETVREYEKKITTDRLFPLTANHIQRVFRKASDGKITPHSLRHFFATRCVEYGINMRVIQEFLGHSSIVTTQRYTQVSNSTLKEVYDSKFRNGVV